MLQLHGSVGGKGGHGGGGDGDGGGGGGDGGDGGGGDRGGGDGGKGGAVPTNTRTWLMPHDSSLASLLIVLVTRTLRLVLIETMAVVTRTRPSGQCAPHTFALVPQSFHCLEHAAELVVSALLLCLGAVLLRAPLLCFVFLASASALTEGLIPWPLLASGLACVWRWNR